MEKGVLVGQGRTAEVFSWGDNRILKLFLDWCPAGWVEHEASVTKIAKDSGLAVPDVEELVEVDGRFGIVYERIPGITMLKESAEKPWRLTAYARMLADLHTTIHKCSASGLGKQKDALRDAITNSRALSPDIKEKVITRLEVLPEGNALCHGDFHPDNILISPKGAYIIDWSNATRGNPLADVARTSIMLRTDYIPKGVPVISGHYLKYARKLFHSAYMKRYLKMNHVSEKEVGEWMLPVAAARLKENIPRESSRLMALIRSLIDEKKFQR